MKKRVLLIGSELGKGGAERSISLLSYYLEARYDVTLCILSGRARDKYYKTCGNIVFIDPPDASGVIGKIGAWRYRLRSLRDLKKTKKIDVSISFLEGPDYANVLSSGTEKLILSVRGSKIYDKMIRGGMGLIRKHVLIPLLYRRADRVVCVTNALSQEMSREFNIKNDSLRTIYNFYEISEIKALSMQPLGTEEKKIFTKKVIIASGRLHPQKEHDKMIRIISLIREQEDVRLVILGDGDLKNSLMQYASGLGLAVCDWQSVRKFEEADVYFMGFQENAFKFYQRSSLFVLASSWEGFPNVLAEALICEIPVVATDCYTGPREIMALDGLPSGTVCSPVRTAVGSLMPLLSNTTKANDELWALEIGHWLNRAKPEAEQFERLTNGLTTDVLIDKWVDVIEN